MVAFVFVKFSRRVNPWQHADCSCIIVPFLTVISREQQVTIDHTTVVNILSNLRSYINALQFQIHCQYLSVLQQAFPASRHRKCFNEVTSSWSCQQTKLQVITTSTGELASAISLVFLFGDTAVFN